MMNRFVPMLGRRRLLRAGGGLALFGSAGGLAGAGGALASPSISLVPGPALVPLVGGAHPQTSVWAYDGTVPGPIQHLRQGERFRAEVVNRLAEDTTVHWHGIRLPNAMDGVPGLTQKPIPPGGSFVYDFVPPDAGTFWYHSHEDSLRQVGRGLAGLLIVEEPAPVPVDRDLSWMLSDWRLDRDAQIMGGFGNRMDAGMSGYIGNTVTLNGRVPDSVAVRAGERLRLRLANAAVARFMALRFAGHRPVVVAIDGQPCDPHEPDGGRILLGPAMRVDLMLDLLGEPGRRYPVRDEYYDRLDYTLVDLAYDQVPPIRRHIADAPLRLPPNPLPEPDLATAERHVIALQGGMMGGMNMNGMMGGGALWAINGTSMTGDGSADMRPLLTFRRGSSVILALKNETAWCHPMHLHGHSFRVLSRGGVALSRREYGDTVLVPARQTVEVAFVADNPGDWMLHCHVMDHQMAGLMTVLRVT